MTENVFDQASRLSIDSGTIYLPSNRCDYKKMTGYQAITVYYELLAGFNDGKPMPTKHRLPKETLRILYERQLSYHNQAIIVPQPEDLEAALRDQPNDDTEEEPFEINRYWANRL